MRTDRAVTRPSSKRVAMRPIVDRQTPVKTLPSPLRSVVMKETVNIWEYKVGINAIIDSFVCL